MTSRDVIVVGAGVMGAAAALALARRGCSVLLLERFQVGHAFGSSHGPSRIIRLAYGAPEYIALSRRAYQLWRALEAEAGTRLLLQTGGIDIGSPDLGSIQAIQRAMSATGVRYSVLSAGEARGIYPQLRIPEGNIVVRQDEAGILAADICVETLVKRATRLGATLRENETVLSIRAAEYGVEVSTSAGRYGADRLVLCAGPGMRDFLATTLGWPVPLFVSKEQVAYFESRRPELFAPARFPVAILHSASTCLSSVFPIFRAEGVKMMIEDKAVADDGDWSMDEQRLEKLRRFAVDLIPDLTGVIPRAEVCRYTLTSDEDFLIDCHPEHPQIVVASPCSGHGFKFGVVIGEILADLATGAAPAEETAMFRASRFGAAGRQRALSRS